MITEKTFQGAWRVSAMVGERLVSRQYFMPKKDAVASFKHATRIVYLNWNGPQGRETIDELCRADFEQTITFQAELRRLKAEYALAGMHVYVSSRACANWSN